MAGQSPPSGVTGITTAKNTSAFNVTNLTITDPSTTSPSDFADVIPTGLQLVFPAGATSATGQVTCSDGTTFPFSAAAPPTTVRPILTGCPTGALATSVTVTFTGSIPSGASGQLGIHAVLKPSAAGGDELTDCSDANIAGGSSGGATGTGCGELLVQNPDISVGGTKSSTNPPTGGGLVPGQTLGFSLTATNHGNLPVTSFEIDDPSNPPPASNGPFTFLTITSASVSVTPPSTPAPTFAVEVFNGTAWVPFSSAVAVGATGVRARLTSGLVVPNQTVTLNLATQVSGTIPPGTSSRTARRPVSARARGQPPRRPRVRKRSWPSLPPRLAR